MITKILLIVIYFHLKEFSGQSLSCKCNNSPEVEKNLTDILEKVSIINYDQINIQQTNRALWLYDAVYNYEKNLITFYCEEWCQERLNAEGYFLLIRIDLKKERVGCDINRNMTKGKKLFCVPKVKLTDLGDQSQLQIVSEGVLNNSLHSTPLKYENGGHINDVNVQSVWKKVLLYGAILSACCLPIVALFLTGSFKNCLAKVLPSNRANGFSALSTTSSVTTKQSSSLPLSHFFSPFSSQQQSTSISTTDKSLANISQQPQSSFLSQSTNSSQVKKITPSSSKY